MSSLLIIGELLCFNYHQDEINVIIGNLIHLNMCPWGIAFAIFFFIKRNIRKVLLHFVVIDAKCTFYF
jgi:hypothetical protein